MSRDNYKNRARATPAFKAIFGWRFSEALRATGHSARGWAEINGYPPATIITTKNGKVCPGLERAAEYAHALGVSLDWLVGNTDEGGPAS